MELKTADLPFRVSRDGRYINASDRGKEREIASLYPCCNEQGIDDETIRQNHGFLFSISPVMWRLVVHLYKRHNDGHCLDPETFSEIRDLIRKREELEKSRL